MKHQRTAQRSFAAEERGFVRRSSAVGRTDLFGDAREGAGAQTILERLFHADPHLNGT